jgi:hypothetical protein
MVYVLYANYQITESELRDVVKRVYRAPDWDTDDLNLYFVNITGTKEEIHRFADLCLIPYESNYIECERSLIVFTEEEMKVIIGRTPENKPMPPVTARMVADAMIKKDPELLYNLATRWDEEPSKFFSACSDTCVLLEENKGVQLMRKLEDFFDVDLRLGFKSKYEQTLGTRTMLSLPNTDKVALLDAISADINRLNQIKKTLVS